MRSKISNKNINFYLAQRYGCKNMNDFFKFSEASDKFREKVVTEIVEKFTAYRLENGKLVCYNPYTSKNEVLKIKNFKHIQSKEDLLKELSMLDKTHKQMLVQSRKRILKLSKKQTLKRDHDLTTKIEITKSKRLQQIMKSKEIADKELGLEQEV